VLIAGPNLTTDRTLEIDELRPGEVMRFTRATVTPGGKGVNVARVALALGAPATLVALAPGRTGRAVVELLEDEGIHVQAVPTSGEVRAAIVVLEQSGRTTVLNEPGPPIADEEWTAYEEAVAAAIPEHRVLVCSGSVPPGAPADAYGRLVRLARERGAAALVDAAGEALAAALAAEPDFVTPNYVEAEGVVLGRRTDEGGVPPSEARERACAAVARLAERVRLAIVTAGAAGVALAGETEAAWIEAPPVPVRNSVGAGDSFVGGFAGAVERGGDVRSAVVAGMAAAAASVETALAGGVDPRRVEELARVVASYRFEPCVR
jgi:1-phosphofructokinase family hexose kinase